jgi:hypothetical protein
LPEGTEANNENISQDGSSPTTRMRDPMKIKKQQGKEQEDEK